MAQKGIHNMKYDFDSIIDRTGRDAIAVDVIPFEGAEIKSGFSRIPMWVADMNFATVPTIQEEIIGRTKHPAFGYFEPRDEYYSSIIEWQNKRNGVTGLAKEDIGYENGVLGCIASAAQAFTAPGEAVLLHSPTYIGFTRVQRHLIRPYICGNSTALSRSHTVLSKDSQHRFPARPEYH